MNIKMSKKLIVAVALAVMVPVVLVPSVLANTVKDKTAEIENIKSEYQNHVIESQYEAQKNKLLEQKITFNIPSPQMLMETRSVMVELPEIVEVDPIESLKKEILTVYSVCENAELIASLNSDCFTAYTNEITNLQNIIDKNDSAIVSLKAYYENEQLIRIVEDIEKEQADETIAELEEKNEQLKELIIANLTLIEDIIRDGFEENISNFDEEIAQDTEDLVKMEAEIICPDNYAEYDPVFPTPGYEARRWQTSGFGYRWGAFHWGYDIGARAGSPIVATDSGVVTSASYSDSWGNNVLIKHTSSFSTRSAHMSRMIVKTGDYVEKGQVIGYVGSTGDSTGAHLHFEVYKNGKRVNPATYIGQYVI